LRHKRQPSGAAHCGIARAAFGEADIRWMIFRAWLVDDAPAWFTSFISVTGGY